MIVVMVFAVAVMGAIVVAAAMLVAMYDDCERCVGGGDVCRLW